MAEQGNVFVCKTKVLGRLERISRITYIIVGTASNMLIFIFGTKVSLKLKHMRTQFYIVDRLAPSEVFRVLLPFVNEG